MLALQAFVAIWVAGVAVAQRNKYYNINDMPLTNFDCRDKILGGYYADPEVNCQMFHVCVKTPGQGVQDFRFLCPNGTVFDQEQQICADSGDIDCASSGLFLDNFDLYRLGEQGTAPASKPRPTFGFVSRNTPIPLGPSTQSPILSNSVADDDDFYLQRSETGDRRLHSKDLLRGSSSSNLFNSRNGGKDLDDDDDVDTPRNNNQTPQSYRPKPSQQSRGKSQYNTQFRRTEPTTTSTTVSSPTSTTTTPIPPRQQEEKKRTKVAVRKLARKRPTTPEQVQSTPATFTTQVTQKLTFGDPIDQRYSTINRSPASPSSPFPQQPNRQYQQNLRARTEATTPAVPINYQQQQQQQQQLNRGTTFQPSHQPQGPTTPHQASPSFHQGPAQPSTAFQQNYRQNEPSSTPAFFEPSGSPTPRPGGFHGRPIVAEQTYQSPQPSSTQAPQTRSPTQQFSYNQNKRTQNQFRQNSPQSRPTQPPNQNFNTQQPTQQFNSAPAVPQNSQPFDSQKNKQFQQKNTQPKKQQANTQFNPQNNQYTAQPKQQYNAQYSQQNNQQFSSQPKQYTPQPTQAQQYTPQPTQHSAQNNQQFSAQPQFDSQPNQQFNSQNQYTPQTQQFNQQGVRVTASPTPQTRAPATLPVVRAQTINAALQPQSTSLRPFSPIDDFEDNDQQEFLKTAQSSNFRPSDINSFSNTYKSGGEKAAEVTKAPTTKYYTPTIITTPKPAAPSTTQAPRPSAPPAPIPQSSKNKDQDKGDYDYAYYDDGNTFSEYDALDALGEQDFSRTSQRSKSRLI